ncbi:MAG: hypothetical protein GXP53_07090 [Deltaproteobacteria bacterium]|nr:hypothetical protein [Deltaproteobacteria bacterium]
MATITVKNINDKTYKSLKELAAGHNRSINGEVIHLIEKASKSTKIDLNQYLIEARKFRKKTKKNIINDTTLTEAKNEARP